MPEGAVYVGRPTKWGNPYVVKEFINTCGHTRYIPINKVLEPSGTGGYTKKADALNQAVWVHYQYDVQCFIALGEIDISELRGKDLACWCPLDQPCHADVLLELANAK